MVGSKAAIAGFVLIVVLFLANAGVSSVNTHRLVAIDEEIVRSRQVLDRLEQVRAAAALAESAERGFLITGDERFRRDFFSTAHDARLDLEVLSKYVSADEPRRREVAELGLLLEAQFAWLEQTMKDKRASRAMAREEAAERLTGIRRQEDALEAMERALLTSRSRESARRLGTKVLTNIVGTTVGIGVTCLAFFIFLRTLRFRRRSEAAAQAEATRQQAIAELRHLALSDLELDALMDRAARTTARALDVPLVKILELLPGGQRLLLRAGVGWKPGTVGQAVVSAGLDSQAGYTLYASRPVVGGDLTTHQPIVVRDLGAEERFRGPPLLTEHGVVSGMSTIIYDVPDSPYGILGAHTTETRVFSEEEISFLSTSANVLAGAVQRRRAENALRESENRFRALAESVPEIVWTSRADGTCDYVNRRWCDFTGLSAAEAMDFRWTRVLHPDDVERSKSRWMESMENGKLFECEFRFRGADGGYRWFLGRALPHRNEVGEVVKWFGNCMDIDSHLRLERALEEADRRKNDFLAMLAHELRNPLTPISVVGEILRSPDLDESRIREASRMIEEQVHHMTRLIEDLSDVSRIVHGKIRIHPRRIPVTSIVDRAMAQSRPALEARGHRIAINLPDAPLHVDADLTRMAQVLSNLLTNAAKYMDPEGRIDLTAGREQDSVTLRVRDEGIGIPPELLDSIFEDFFQVARSQSRSQGGLGLGLGLVRRLVEMHGGTVTAISDGPGHGSEFVVRLPASEEAPPGNLDSLLTTGDPESRRVSSET